MLISFALLLGALHSQGVSASRGESVGEVAKDGHPEFLPKARVGVSRRLSLNITSGTSTGDIAAQESHTCQEYGCVGYNPDHVCQCNHLCNQYGNCCEDMAAICVSCQAFGCVGYTPGHICQCNDVCAQYGNCCSDYEATCTAQSAPPATAPTQLPTPRPTAFPTGSPTPQPRPRPAPTPSSPTPEIQPTPVPVTAPSPLPTFAPLPPVPTSPSSPPTLSPAPVILPPVSSGLPAGHPDPAKQYPEHPGFTLWVVEEFDEPLDLDSDPIWTWSDGGLGEGIVRFVKEGIEFEDGKMKIYARDDLEVPIERCSHAESGIFPHKRLTSGELRTRYNQFRYGRYEVSMKAPSVQPGDTTTDGNYIATMFVFRDAKFRHWREIDIEATGGSPHSVTTNVLHADNTAYWNPFIAKAVEIQVPFNSREDFHTYAFEWLPESVTWYIDGEEVRSHHCRDGVPVPDLSGKVMMNLWIFSGDGFGGRKFYNNRWPMHTEYDWFRFYKWDGEQQYPCSDMSSSCLTEDDLFLTSNNPCDGIEQVGRDGVCIAPCRR